MKIFNLPDIQQRQEGNLWRQQWLYQALRVPQVSLIADHLKRIPSGETFSRQKLKRFPLDVCKILHIAVKQNCKFFNFSVMYCSLGWLEFFDLILKIKIPLPPEFGAQWIWKNKVKVIKVQLLRHFMVVVVAWKLCKF